MAARKIYFEQYGAVWAIKPERAYALAVEAIKGKGWNLDDFGKQLKGRPGIRHETHRALDWNGDDWKQFKIALAAKLL